MGDRRRLTPRTDEVLASPELEEPTLRLGRGLVKRTVAQVLHEVRRGELAQGEVIPSVLASLPASATTLQPVLNATGVLVHTNLGRAPLSPAAVEAMARASGPTDVELDLPSGQRGARGRAALATLAAAVPDAEAVHVVNNGAAAVALAVCALSAGREVLVARGELVEIGDGFRLPELIESVGARIREVGTTNRVRLSDYADAVGERTALVLKVHPSNFVVSGFTSSVSVSELVTLHLPVIADVGSGLLRPHPRLPREPDAASYLRAGAHLVTCSGDKLLGGPQCGLVLGSAELVHRLRRHPLARALRVDKLTLAALEASLAGPTPPVLHALDQSPGDLWRRAAEVAERIGAPARPVRSTAVVGGGGAPGVELESAAVALPARCAATLRTASSPVLGRVASGELLLDLFAVSSEEDGLLVEACITALAAHG